MFHNDYDNEKNTSNYNGYNFAHAEVMDDFWYDVETELLLYTVPYIIGTNEVQIATVRLLPTRYVEVGREVKTKVLGLAIEHEDRIVTNITMKKNLNINVNGRVPVHDGDYFKRSDVTIMLDHDFTEVEYLIKYFGFADIMSKIGGIVASLNPLMALLAPMLIIFYLSTLS